MGVPWNKIRKEIQSHAQTAIVAVSGGVDSVFLLDFISRCNIKFCVAYFDHGLGNGDASFVSSLAAKYGVPYYQGTGVDIDKASSIEAEARTQRYAFLNGLRAHGYDKIVTGHHATDQVETILLRLLRGYDHSTLGMEKFSQHIYRPLIEVDKDEIIQQSTHRKLKWIDDASNSDMAFERNWLRNSIIPQLMERRNVQKTIVKGLGK